MDNDNEKINILGLLYSQGVNASGYEPKKRRQQEQLDISSALQRLNKIYQQDLLKQK